MNNHRAHSTFGPGDVKQVILSIHLKQLWAFGRQTDIIPWRSAGILYENTFGPFLDAGQIGFQLSYPQFTTTPDYINTPIIVKENRMIMIRGSKRDCFPRTFFYIFRSIYIGLPGSAWECRYIIHIIMIANTACPCSASISIFSIIQVQYIYISQNIIAVIHQLPVHKIFWPHNGDSRSHVHGRTTHIVSISHPDYRHIGYIGINHRISGRASLAQSCATI